MKTSLTNTLVTLLFVSFSASTGAIGNDRGDFDRREGARDRGNSNHRNKNDEEPFFLPNHPHIPPGPGDERSPCPFTNAMANHGFVNRNGKDIDIFDMVQSMEEVFDLSADFVNVVAENTIDFGLTHKGPDGRDLINLERLFEHNFEEHDASFVRQDEFFGAEQSREVDLGLLRDLLRTNLHSPVLTSDDIKRVQFRRIIDSRLNNPEFIIDDFEIPLLAAQAITLLFLQDSINLADGVPKDRLGEFLRFERIPQDFIPRGMRDANFRPFNFFDSSDFTSGLHQEFIANIMEALEADLSEYQEHFNRGQGNRNGRGGHGGRGNGRNGFQSIHGGRP